MYKGNPRLSHEAKAEQSVTEHTLSSTLMTKAVGLALASKWHDFGWRPTRRPGTRTGPKNSKVLSSKSKHWTVARARLHKSVSTILKYSNDGLLIMGSLRTPLVRSITVSMKVPSKERVWARH